MKHTSITVALALALGLPLAAGAQQAPAGQLTQAHFDRLDTNKDGKVSRAEYQQHMDQAFGRLDKDGNGHLDPAEAGQVMTPEQFSKVDADGNGQISKAEFMDRVTGDFDRQDRNRDGYLTYP